MTIYQLCDRSADNCSRSEIFAPPGTQIRPSKHMAPRVCMEKSDTALFFADPERYFEYPTQNT